MGRDFRPTFDPEADFFAARVFTCAGKKFAPGDWFDKSLVDTRRLRQMYEVVHFLSQEPPKAAAKPKPQAKVGTKPVSNSGVPRFRPAV